MSLVDTIRAALELEVPSEIPNPWVYAGTHYKWSEGKLWKRIILHSKSTWIACYLGPESSPMDKAFKNEYDTRQCGKFLPQFINAARDANP